MQHALGWILMIAAITAYALWQSGYTITAFIILGIIIPVGLYNVYRHYF